MIQEDPTPLPKFVVVTLPRSGSYNLVSLLNSAPDIVCHGEVFKPNVVELGEVHLGKMGMKPEDIAERDAKPVAFLQRLRRLNGGKIVGFKMFLEHANRVKPLGGQVLRNPEWRKIFLRRNPIESYASLLRARQTSIWVLRSAAKTPPPAETLNARVTFTPETLDGHLWLTERFEKVIAETAAVAGNQVMTVDYEQVADRSALPELLRFVGSSGSAESLRSEYGRQFTGKLSDGFTNWEDLVQHVRAGGHESVLDAVA